MWHPHRHVNPLAYRLLPAARVVPLLADGYDGRAAAGRLWERAFKLASQGVMADRRTSQILVREPMAADEPAVAEVHALAIADLRKVYRPNQRALDHLSKLSPKLLRLVATRDERVVGTVQYRFEDDRVLLTALSVHPVHRRQGVARALVGALMGIAKATRSSGLALYTVRETGNVAIFERLGFRTVHQGEEDFFESDEHAVLTKVYMERSLDVSC